MTTPRQTQELTEQELFLLEQGGETTEVIDARRKAAKFIRSVQPDAVLAQKASMLDEALRIIHQALMFDMEDGARAVLRQLQECLSAKSAPSPDLVVLPKEVSSYTAHEEEIMGLEVDLGSCVDVLFRRGDAEAREYVRLNYPKQYASLSKAQVK